MFIGCSNIYPILGKLKRVEKTGLVPNISVLCLELSKGQGIWRFSLIPPPTCPKMVHSIITALERYFEREKLSTTRKLKKKKCSI
jgi:hypothetical protein